MRPISSRSAETGGGLHPRLFKQLAYDNTLISPACILHISCGCVAGRRKAGSARWAAQDARLSRIAQMQVRASGHDMKRSIPIAVRPR